MTYSTQLAIHLIGFIHLRMHTQHCSCRMIGGVPSGIDQLIVGSADELGFTTRTVMKLKA